ncbi:DNA polymerase III subunit delta' [Vibrio sinensis]|uniref:DNA polymerase III subunit delta' n=1 Tax=Vibrio sinensis TaxID=2302434 RepID=A0A3A6QUI8_9VIBR|nr:DNA polymerase III subunit delta' [Vibrio sinensis]RJX72019.1 DNA polymerase III subunit delta' [Vibrio sinensis]
MNKLYPWLGPLWQQWQLSLEADRFSNATLLLAKEGMGADQLVEKFSRAVMCSNYASDACGFCHSCQLMQSHNHPDFHIVKPEKEGKNITVDQIRQCTRLAQESSQLSGYRIIIIEPAEAMNESAANALLKTLETPAEKCLFLLIATGMSSLLPTITSRCQQWHLTAPEDTQLVNWLAEQTSKPVPAYAAHINGYAPLTTLAFIEQGDADRFQMITDQFVASLKLQGDMVKLAKDLASDSGQQLEWLWYSLTDAQKYHFGMRLPDATPCASVLANVLDYSLLYTQTQALTGLIEQLNQHSGLNKELLILDWLFKFDGETCL